MSESKNDQGPNDVIEPDKEPTADAQDSHILRSEETAQGGQ